MRILAFIFFVLAAVSGFAEEKKYGSFILNTDIPNTLFFIDKIKPNDSFELRKALRNHEIENIVLASPGGSVFEGLQMAGIIHDKRLRTYIPRGGICASACSYLFFAGNERLADGELGVHQAKSTNAQKQQAIGQTQYVTQFTVSEIIGFLNEFGTPAFVYERMFQDIDMYYFDPLELMQLNSDAFGLENSEKIFATKFMMTKIKELEKKEPELTRKEMIALIQTRLKEIGCNPGPSDGIWGRRTQSAAVAFAKKAGLPTSEQELISAMFIEKLADAPRNFCPKVAVKPKPTPTRNIRKLFFAGSYKITCTTTAPGKWANPGEISKIEFNQSNRRGSFQLHWKTRQPARVKFSVTEYNDLRIEFSNGRDPITARTVKDSKLKVRSLGWIPSSKKYCRYYTAVAQ